MDERRVHGSLASSKVSDDEVDVRELLAEARWTTFTKSTGESYSFSQQHVISQQPGEFGLNDGKEQVGSVEDDEEEIDSLIDKVLNYKQLQEARNAEKNHLMYIFKLHAKMEEILKDNKELKEGAQELMSQSVFLRDTVQNLTAQNNKLRKEATKWQSKFDYCTGQLELTKEQVRKEKKKRKLAEQQCILLSSQVKDNFCRKCQDWNLPVLQVSPSHVAKSSSNVDTRDKRWEIEPFSLGLNLSSTRDADFDLDSCDVRTLGSESVKTSKSRDDRSVVSRASSKSKTPKRHDTENRGGSAGVSSTLGRRSSDPSARMCQETENQGCSVGGFRPFGRRSSETSSRKNSDRKVKREADPKSEQRAVTENKVLGKKIEAFDVLYETASIGPKETANHLPDLIPIEYGAKCDGDISSKKECKGAKTVFIDLTSSNRAQKRVNSLVKNASFASNTDIKEVTEAYNKAALKLEQEKIRAILEQAKMDSESQDGNSSILSKSRRYHSSTENTESDKAMSKTSSKQDEIRQILHQAQLELHTDRSIQRDEFSSTATGHGRKNLKFTRNANHKNLVSQDEKEDMGKLMSLSCGDLDTSTYQNRRKQVSWCEHELTSEGLSLSCGDLAEGDLPQEFDEDGLQRTTDSEADFSKKCVSPTASAVPTSSSQASNRITSEKKVRASNSYSNVEAGMVLKKQMSNHEGIGNPLSSSLGDLNCPALGNEQMSKSEFQTCESLSFSCGNSVDADHASKNCGSPPRSESSYGMKDLFMRQRGSAEASSPRDSCQGSLGKKERNTSHNVSAMFSLETFRIKKFQARHRESKKATPIKMDSSDTTTKEVSARSA